MKIIIANHAILHAKNVFFPVMIIVLNVMLVENYKVENVFVMMVGIIIQEIVTYAKNHVKHVVVPLH